MSAAASTASPATTAAAVASPSASDRTALIAATEKFVQTEMAKNDGSHDWHHIDRVRKLAVSLGREQRVIVAEKIAARKAGAGAGAAASSVSASESKSGDDALELEPIDDDTLLVVELAALLHDIKDWKYSGSETAGAEAAVEYLNGQTTCKLPASIVARVQHVINFIGFKSELGYSASGAKERPRLTQELGIVQDADRLDAIGAIGIARCFTYGGSKGRALYDPADPPIANITKEQYVQQNKNNKSASLNHFYEKLFLLHSMMKTAAGKKRAEGRHKYMQEFVDRFHAEWNGTA